MCLRHGRWRLANELTDHGKRQLPNLKVPVLLPCLWRPADDALPTTPCPQRLDRGTLPVTPCP